MTPDLSPVTVTVTVSLARLNAFPGTRSDDFVAPVMLWLVAGGNRQALAILFDDVIVLSACRQTGTQ